LVGKTNFTVWKFKGENTSEGGTILTRILKTSGY